MKKRIGLFGGTFDPIHFGHLNLALQLSEKRSLDLVFFCPAFQSPFKKKASLFSPNERLEMVQLAIEKIPGFQLLDLEVTRGGVSYTIDTLRVLHERFRDSATLYLLLSQDALSNFHRWKEAKEIVRLCKPLVGMRQGSSQKIPASSVRSHLRKGLTSTSQMEISSTEIRDRLKKKLYCGHLIPEPVLKKLL